MGEQSPVPSSQDPVGETDLSQTVTTQHWSGLRWGSPGVWVGGCLTQPGCQGGPPGGGDGSLIEDEREVINANVPGRRNSICKGPGLRGNLGLPWWRSG